MGPIGNGDDDEMGTPDLPEIGRIAELLRHAGWTTSVRKFRVPGRTHWVVWCSKGTHHVAGRGDSREEAWRAAHRQTARKDAS